MAITAPVRWSSTGDIPSGALAGRLGVPARRCVDLDTGDAWSVEELQLPRLAGGGLDVCNLLRAEMARLRQLQRIMDSRAGSGDAGVLSFSSSSARGQRRHARHATWARRAIGARVIEADAEADADADAPLTVCVFTELPDGGAFTLAQLLRGTGPLPLAAVRPFARRLLRALRAIHTAGGSATAPPLCGGAGTAGDGDAADAASDDARGGGSGDGGGAPFVSALAPSAVTLRVGGAISLGVPWGSAARRLARLHHGLLHGKCGAGGDDGYGLPLGAGEAGGGADGRARDMRAVCFTLLALAAAPPPSSCPGSGSAPGSESGPGTHGGGGVRFAGRVAGYASAAWGGGAALRARARPGDGSCWAGGGATAAVRDALTRALGPEGEASGPGGAEGGGSDDTPLRVPFTALLEACLAPGARAGALLGHRFCTGADNDNDYDNDYDNDCDYDNASASASASVGGTGDGAGREAASARDSAGSPAELTQVPASAPQAHAPAPAPAGAHARDAAPPRCALRPAPHAFARAPSKPLDLGVGAEKRSRARKLFAHRQRISDVISRLDSAGGTALGGHSQTARHDSDSD
eukprot:g1699.t1